MHAMLDSHEESPQILHSYVLDEDEFYGINTDRLARLREEWNGFGDELKYKNRFMPSRTIDLDVLKRIFPASIKVLGPGEKFYRARLSKDGQAIPPNNLGRPPAEFATAGRANPVGISYLYMASNEYTAISEVRPTVTDRVSVGTFIAKDEVRLVDLLRPGIKSPFDPDIDLELTVKHLGYMRLLGDEISKPVNPRTSNLDYLQSQYLCEFIKTCGYDGVLFKSS